MKKQKKLCSAIGMPILSLDSEGKLRGGFVGLSGGIMPLDNDSGCRNTACNNNACQNANCNGCSSSPNDSCNNTNCINTGSCKNDNCSAAKNSSAFAGNSLLI